MMVEVHTSPIRSSDQIMMTNVLNFIETIKLFPK